MLLLLLLHIVGAALLSAPLGQMTLLDEVTSEFNCLDRTCYSISWDSQRYSKAKKSCKVKNGQLLTVKNSVPADAIDMFMARTHKEDARVWIGLEQQDRGKCTDLQQKLRGFTWVTGDSHTDYTKWRSDGQKCGALCVTVRQDGTWEETECDSKADGYLCEISYSALCSSLVLPSFHNVTYYHLALGKGHIGDSFFPPGTMADIVTFTNITRLSCEEKADGTVSWGRETPGAWSCLIANGGCEHGCMEESGIAECKCPPGSELKSDQRGCTKPCDPSPCNEQYVPDPEGLLHKCPGGYTLSADGETCEDIDECAADPNICEHTMDSEEQMLNRICTNTDGNYTCDCKPGYELGTAICDSEDNCVTHCHIMDECDNHMCEQTCESYPGGHRCVCHKGYTIDEKDRNKCKRVCDTASCQADCPKDNECMCPQGYILEHADNGGKVCNDVDECAISVCNWLCKNTFGSFLCTCPEGYTMDNGECIHSTRAPSETILDTSPTSTCPEGYIIENGKCIAPTRAPAEIILDTSPTRRPADVYSLQPVIMWGICSGLLSMLIVLIVMLSHRMRKHYIYQHDLDYNYKNGDKDVVLKKVIMDPQWRL